VIEVIPAGKDVNLPGLATTETLTHELAKIQGEPLSETILLVHCAFVSGQNSRVAAIAFGRPVHYFRFPRHPPAMSNLQETAAEFDFSAATTLRCRLRSLGTEVGYNEKRGNNTSGPVSEPEVKHVWNLASVCNNAQPAALRFLMICRLEICENKLEASHAH
jgi:hypothetical protein